MEGKSVVIIGATGSIGRQTLEVLRKLRGFKLVGFTYHRNEKVAKEVEREFGVEGVSTLKGKEGFLRMMESTKPDITVAAAPGFAGFELAYLSIPFTRRLALANKESMVCGGWLMKEELERYGVELIPVDSEHSAVFQLLEREIVKIAITASGGALRDWPLEKLLLAKPEDVLRHPVWSMGKRITVDSATMVNKALEVLEAMELFGLEREEIEVFVHREGIVHGMVFLRDGTVKVHASIADMRIPIALSLTYPERLYEYPSFPVFEKLTFEKPSKERYPLFFLVDEIHSSYAMRTAFNAADEVAVEAFLSGAIEYTGIFRVVEEVVRQFEGVKVRDFEDLKAVDGEARRLACEETKFC